MRWMRRGALLACALLALPAVAGPPPAKKPAPQKVEKYVPAPADQIPGYWAKVMPCKIHGETTLECPPGLLPETLRERAILRNTIFARYGWAGFRKPWLREHFQKQPWYKPNPNFGFKLLSKVDRQNVHIIGLSEQWSYPDLLAHREEILTRAGGEDKLTPEDRIELGLTSRAMGFYAADSGKLESQSQASLDRVLSVQELRQLSLRDLRVLRNTLYARRGRPFKSKVLQKHFESMAWYKVDPQYTDAKLTETDLRNVALIRSVEDEFGGALADADWLIDPNVGMA